MTENCAIREHTGDGHYVGRCDHYLREGFCPRHGRVSDYPTLDDREVDPQERTHRRVCDRCGFVTVGRRAWPEAWVCTDRRACLVRRRKARP